MPQPEAFRIDLKRSPVEGVDPADTARTRLWLRDQITSRHLHGGRLRPRLVYLGDGFVEEADIERLAEIGNEETLARLFVAVGQREGVRRRFRVGDGMVRDDEGHLRRAVAVLEHMPDADRASAGREGAVGGSWWLTYRLAGQGRDGHGNLLGTDWIEMEGDGIDALPEGFQEWLDVGRAELASLEERAKPTPPEALDIQAGFVDLIRPLPTDAKAAAAVIGGIMREELLSQGLGCLLVFAATESTLERWEARGTLPCTLDDLIRSVATRNRDIVAVGHVAPAAFDINGQSRRGFYVDVECGGRRGRWLLPVLQAGDPVPQGFVGMEGDLGAPAADAAWLGVVPKVGLDFAMLGIGDQFGLLAGGEIPEG